MRTRVKICGITRAEDAQTAARLGADAIGLVFHDASPRNVTLEQAHALLRCLPPFVTRVGLFVDADPGLVEQIVSLVPLDLLQFHGQESAADCARHDKPYIKAIRMKPGLVLREAISAYAEARGILLDTYSNAAVGGTGETFDWTGVPTDLERPIILAGGLNPGNVAAAIQQVRPYAVDVSSGVESSKGIKSAEKMSAFINEVNRQL